VLSKTASKKELRKGVVTLSRVKIEKSNKKITRREKYSAPAGRAASGDKRERSVCKNKTIHTKNNEPYKNQKLKTKTTEQFRNLTEFPFIHILLTRE